MDFTIVAVVVVLALMAVVLVRGHKSAVAKSEAGIENEYAEQMAKAVASADQGEINRIARSKELFYKRGEATAV